MTNNPTMHPVVRARAFAFTTGRTICTRCSTGIATVHTVATFFCLFIFKLFKGHISCRTKVKSFSQAELSWGDYHHDKHEQNGNLQLHFIVCMEKKFQLYWMYKGIELECFCFKILKNKISRPIIYVRLIYSLPFEFGTFRLVGQLTCILLLCLQTTDLLSCWRPLFIGKMAKCQLQKLLIKDE